MQPRRPQVQRAPSISTTMCPISPAPPRPVHGCAAEDQAAADARPPEDAEQRAVQAPGAQLELGVGRDLDVVADPHLAAERRFEASPPAGSVPSQPGRLRALRDVAVFDRPRRPHPDARQRGGLDPGRAGGVAQRRLHLGRHVGRPAAWSASARASRAEHVMITRRRSRPGSSSRRGRSRRRLDMRADHRRTARPRRARGGCCQAPTAGTARAPCLRREPNLAPLAAFLRPLLLVLATVSEAVT